MQSLVYIYMRARGGRDEIFSGCGNVREIGSFDGLPLLQRTALVRARERESERGG